MVIHKDKVAMQRDNYAWFYPQITRWHDNDVYGHVNNVVYYSYFDTTANQYLIEKGGFDIHDSPQIGFVVASSCEYLSPISHPSELEIGFRVNHLGNTSVEYGLAVFVVGEHHAKAIASLTHVFVDRLSGKPSSIKPSLRQALVEAK